MGKSPPGQRHHGGPASEPSADLVALRDERRAQHELAQALKYETTQARAALAELRAQRDSLRESTRQVIRAVVLQELATFRERTQQSTDSLVEKLKGANISVETHVAKVLGFADAQAFVNEISEKVFAAIKEDLKDVPSAIKREGGDYR